MSAYTIFTILTIFVFLTRFILSDEIGRHIYHFCPNTTTFTRNSTYFANLQTLFSSLSSQTAFFSTGFHSATVGRSPDTVTGLFLCQGGDSPEEVCRACVNFAVYDVLENYCPNEKEATIWYNPCMLRYSYRNIRNTLVTEPNAMLNEEDNVTASLLNRFNEVLMTTLNETATQAANDPKKFAVKKANYTSNGKIYALLRCTPDLTRDECLICLQKAISGFTGGRIGARNLLPSCGARYEPLSFFDENALEAITPSSAPTSRQTTAKGRKSYVTIASVSITIAAALLLLSAGGYFLAKRGRKTYDTAPGNDARDEIKTAESMQYDFETLSAATDNFSKINRVGKGGFGEVYKGIFLDGTEVAVKRLSKTSSQGLQEFKNEVVLVAKLQHKNLVRLLGFCLEGEEKILVYEFVPNKSLDYFLFDPTKQSHLNWTMRYNIIGGIARGLLYLHQDSRLTIIHRDLKAGNILLDENMNPKISDFGMARIFGMDQTQANTRRVVGTYGYMPPEYAMLGHFSTKSDVYSFGVLVLEIISGKRNSSLCETEDDVGNLVTYAWGFWRNRSLLELVDPAIGENYHANEVMRCIHIALLCVQEHPASRPTLSTIVLMLSSNTITLPVPQAPGFLFRSRHKPSHPRSKGAETDQSSTTAKSVPCSVDDVSITIVDPR